jgi:hypothetical protein
VAVRLLYLSSSSIYSFGLAPPACPARSDASKHAETFVLRHQLADLRRQVAGPRSSWGRLGGDRSADTIAAPRARRMGLFVTLGTALRWHADPVKRRWTYKRTHPGRPPTRHQSANCERVLPCTLMQRSASPFAISNEVRGMLSTYTGSLVGQICRFGYLVWDDRAA